jgi:hypothetical protein
MAARQLADRLACQSICGDGVGVRDEAPRHEARPIVLHAKDGKGITMRAGHDRVDVGLLRHRI